MKEIAGQDGYDATTVIDVVPDYEEDIKYQISNIKNLRVGVPKEYFEVDGLNSEVKQITLDAIARLEKAGAKIKEVSLPHIQYALAVYYILMPAEVSANLARYDGIRYGKSASAENKSLLDFSLFCL